MCIIAIKDRGIKMPTMAEFKIMWLGNPDGAGYMYCHNNRVHIVKGFLKFKEFEKSITELMAKMDTTAIPFIFHFRITTHGGTCKENCHPFPLTDDKKLLRTLSINSNYGIVHNGILAISNNEDKNLSDTMVFIKNQLYAISKMAGKHYWLTNKYTAKLIETLIVGSRVAIMDYRGNIYTFGKGWLKDIDSGMNYSNDGFKTVKYDYSYNQYNRKHGSKYAKNNYYNNLYNNYNNDYVSTQAQWLEATDYVVEYNNTGKIENTLTNENVKFLIDANGRVIEYDFSDYKGYYIDAIAYNRQGQLIMTFNDTDIVHRIEVLDDNIDIYGDNFIATDLWQNY